MRVNLTFGFFILKKILIYYLLPLSFKKIQPPSLCLAMISTDVNKLHLFILKKQWRSIPRLLRQNLICLFQQITET